MAPILSPEFVMSFAGMPVDWGWKSGPNSLGEITYRRTYSRAGEAWFETVARVVNGTYEILEDHCAHYHLPFDQDISRQDAEEMYRLIFDFKFLPPGRGLWMMGTDYVKTRKTGVPLNNCAFVSTEGIADTGDWSFRFGMDLSMLGVGVGFDTKGEGKVVWSPAGTVAPYVIEDSREGWVNSTGELIRWGFGLAPQPIFDYGLIRPRGAKIEGFGGVAEGAYPLIELHESLRSLIEYRADDKITTRDIVDIYNLIGRCVVSGNVRRCLPEGTLVHVKGGAARIEDVQAGWEIETAKGTATVTQVFDQGEQDTMKIVPEWGPTLECTPNHRVAMFDAMANYIVGADGDEIVLDEWQRFVYAKDIAIGESIVFDSWGYEGSHQVLPESGALDVPPLTPKVAWFVGIVQAAGYVMAPDMSCKNCKKRGVVAVGGLDRDMARLVDDAMRMFAIKPEEIIEVKGTHRTAATSVAFADYFRNHVKEAQQPVIVPDFIRYAPQDIRRSYLSGANAARTQFGTDYAEQLVALYAGVGALARIRPQEHAGTVEIEVMDAGDHGDMVTGVKVVGLEPGRYVHTYDIEVENIHQFTAGGWIVHNSAMIGIGASDDEEFLNLKNYELNPDRAAYGWNSNNSVYAEVGQDYSSFVQRIVDNGEPGFIWMENVHKYARINGIEDTRDYRAKGFNPCAEQSLEDGEMCCLVETFPDRHESLEEYQRTLKYAYIYAKAVTLVPSHWEKTNAVMLRNRRIGTSMSGITQFLTRRGEGELVRWMQAGYATIEHYDGVYSEWLCVRESVRKTSVKPSGTVSILAGATPGVHYPTYRHYIRRIRFADSHPDIGSFRDAGYNVVTSPNEPNTVIVEFPVAGDPAIKTEREVSLAQKIRLAALLQEHWADNSVSVTATFDPVTEGHLIPDLLAAYDRRLKTVSLLPLKPQGAYELMPYEAITIEEYEELSEGLKPIAWAGDTVHDQEDQFCDGAACVIG